MAGRKGRSGSKPRGEFPRKSATFTTRIQPETRRALNAYAKAIDKSVSVASERLLKAALQKKPYGEPRNRALAHAVELLPNKSKVRPKKVGAMTRLPRKPCSMAFLICSDTLRPSTRGLINRVN